MPGRASLLCLALAILVVALRGGNADAANWLEMNFYMSGPRYEGRLPPCDHPAALEKIAKRFNQKEGTFWASDLTIVGFEDIRETAFRTWAAQAIPRRFSSGRGEISDGRKHTIHYSIQEDTGMIGAYWGVEWCVVGLDRNWSYNPACRAARPSRRLPSALVRRRYRDLAVATRPRRSPVKLQTRCSHQQSNV